MINKFHAETSEAIKCLLIRLNESGERVRLVYGDTKTGQSWHEENDTIGTIGSSSGAQKIPLLIHNARSSGGVGVGVLDNCILGVLSVKRNVWLYTAPNYVPSVVKAEGLIVTIDGEVYANCETTAKALHLAAFMRLERHKR